MTIPGRWSRLSLSQRLARVAFALGLLAVLARTERGRVVALDLKELATIIDREADHVGAAEVAGWIVSGRADYRLIDLRSEKDYAAYHIPTAENVTLSALPDAGLLANERIVLYSEGGLHAIQAWMLMRAKGHRNVYTLKGGLDQWKDEVLFPTLAPSATAEERGRFERSVALARFFGGSPRTGDKESTVARVPEMPKIEVSAGTASAAPKAGRKKKEGC